MGGGDPGEALEIGRGTRRLIARGASASVAGVGRTARTTLWVAATLLAAGSGRAEPAEVASVGTADAAFAWRSDAPGPTRARVRAAGVEEEWRVFETDDAPARYHALEVGGLAPGTRYEYRLGDGEDGPGGVLTTRDPPPGEPVGVLWVLADIHLCAPEVQECPDGIRRLSAANRIYSAVLAEVRERAAAFPAEMPQAIVVLGDFAQRPVPETWRLLQQSATGDLPLCLVPGNHEGWDGSWATRFAETVAALDDATCRYDGVRGELTLGPWRIVLLATTVPGENWGELGDEQRGWLEERLAAEPARPTLLALHHPWLPHPLSALLGDAATYARIRDAAALDALLDRHAQVHGVLSGHLHLNWAGKRGGVVQHIFSATSQFPVGFHSLTLYGKGLVRRFHPLAAGAAESAASGEALRRWAEERDVPLPGAILGVVAGDTASRSGVQLLEEEEAAPDGEPPAGGDAIGVRGAAPEIDARAAATGPTAPPPDAATAAAPGEDHTSRGGARGAGGGCRCALPGDGNGNGVAGVLVLATILAGGYRRRGRNREERKAEGRWA